MFVACSFFSDVPRDAAGAQSHIMMLSQCNHVVGTVDSRSLRLALGRQEALEPAVFGSAAFQSIAGQRQVNVMALGSKQEASIKVEPSHQATVDFASGVKTPFALDGVIHGACHAVGLGLGKRLDAFLVLREVLGVG